MPDPEHLAVVHDPEHLAVVHDPEHLAVVHDPEHLAVVHDLMHINQLPVTTIAPRSSLRSSLGARGILSYCRKEHSSSPAGNPFFDVFLHSYRQNFFE